MNYLNVVKGQATAEELAALTATIAAQLSFAEPRTMAEPSSPKWRQTADWKTSLR